MRLRHAAAALMIAVVMTLVACSSVPTSGPVQAGASEVPDQPALVFRPEPPVAGADADHIVRGFVQAASEGGNFGVARQFLTPDLAKKWNPSTRVLINDTPWATHSTAPASPSSASISMTVPLTARVDASGFYTPSTRMQPVDFSLVKVNGEWRISKTPDGIVLSQYVFQRTFTHEVLQFWDPSFERLVPDLRWFPKRTSQVQPVVRALLDGPAAPLRGGVTASAFPEGTRIVSATQSAGAVSVSLDIPGIEPSARSLSRMGQQLRGSLQLPAADVTLIVNGQPVPASTAPRAVEPNPYPVVAAGGRFGALNGTGVTQDAALGKSIAALHPEAVTISPQQQFAAVRTAKGVAVVTRRSDRTVDTRPGLIDPTVDQRGWVYSVPRDDPGGLMAYSTSGRAVSLQGSLAATSVIAIEVSPDGARMLVLQVTSSGPLVFVSGIVRARDGSPVGLTADRYLVAVGGADTAIDATWVDSGSVAVLTKQPDGQNVVQTVLGGITTSLGRVVNATNLVGATGTTDLRALLNTGDIAVPRSNVWQPEFSTPVDVDLIAVQR